VSIPILPKTEPHPGVRLVLAAASLVVYAVLFALLQPHFSNVGFPLYVLPVVVAAWGFGLRGALAVGLLGVPFNSLLMNLIGQANSAIWSMERLPAIVSGLLAGLIIGWLFDLHSRLRRELSERVSIESRETEQRAFVDALLSIGTTLNQTLDPPQVFDRILENLDRVAAHDGACLVLVENGDRRVVRYTGGETHTSCHSLRAKMEHLINNAEQLQAASIDLMPATNPSEWQPRSGLVAPILVEGHPIGYLMLFNNQPGAFTDIHAERLQAFADHAAIAIRNAQMYNALESSVIELETIYNATSILLNASSMTELGQKIVEAAMLSLEKGQCALWLIESDSDQVVCLAGADGYTVQQQTALYLDETHPITDAIRQGSTAYIPNLAKDPRYALGPQHVKSKLVIPLRGASGVVGALAFQSSETDGFSDRDQRVLSTFAERAVTAIDNMRLYDTIHQFAIDREQQVIERTSELNRAKERVETILNSSSDTIILTLPEGQIQQSNQAFYSLFGYGIDEEYDWPLSRLVVPDSQQSMDKALQNARDQRRPQRLEVTALRKDGTAFDADVVLSPIHERGGGGCWGIVCSLRDISERKRMEQELREALAKERELRELKSRFISMASHEFRTPLATILATTSLLRNYIDRMDESKKVRQFEKIEEQINYMTGLMNDVLTISRMEAGRTPVSFEPMYLHEFFEEMVEEFEQTQPNHRLNFRCVGEPVEIPVDSKLMREIANNLLSNAAKYSPAGSTVHFDLNYAPDQVIFSVRDEGIGIPESDQARLFEAFHRADNVGTIPGTGLGLSIVKNAVELQGGRISFESRVNEGTTFTVCIPVQRSIKERSHD
jgi:PAS domain S-box-containing protein